LTEAEEQRLLEQVSRLEREVQAQSSAKLALVNKQKASRMMAIGDSCFQGYAYPPLPSCVPVPLWRGLRPGPGLGRPGARNLG